MELGAATALIQKIQTTQDGGLRISLDIPSLEVDLVKKLLEIAVTDKQVTVAFVKVEM